MKKIIILALLMCFLFSVNVCSEEVTKEELINQLKMIQKISNTEERLKEYDKLVDKINAIEQDTSINIEDKGKWSVDVETDPLTDEKQIYLMLSEEGSSYYGGKYLSIRKMDQKIDLLINWNDYLADNTLVKYRFDKGEVVTAYWVGSTDNTATFLSGNIEEFIKKLIDAERFVASITPYRSGEITVVFDVRGLKNALLPYLDDFGLSYFID